MKVPKFTRPVVLIFAALTLFTLGMLVRTNSSEAAKGAENAWTAIFTPLATPTSRQSPDLGQSGAEQAQLGILPADLGVALAREFGHYEGLVNEEGLLNDLQTADIVCIGEAHYDQRDMETAFEITRLLARRRKVALAVERFSNDLQPRLDGLNTQGSEELRAAEVKKILQTNDYQRVWGMDPWGQSGFHVNTPSEPIFEAMVAWAARARIPMIGLDVSLSDRANGLGENIPYRNELWNNQVEKFLNRNHQENYLVVVVGGIDHIANSPDSVPSRMKGNSKANRVISIGQRDAMYQYLSSAQVAKLAKAYGLGDLIVRHPQYAVVGVNGVAKFPDPPDYWIALHTPDSWN
jgi:hypothetical protein